MAPPPLREALRVLWYEGYIRVSSAGAKTPAAVAFAYAYSSPCLVSHLGLRRA